MHSPFIEQALKPFETVMKHQKNLSLEEQEIIYAAAHGFYEHGDYEKSAGNFVHLVMTNPFEKKFWKGLASARQMQKEYKAALHAWAIVCLLDDQDPFPHFHAAENLHQLQEKEEAMKALACAEALLKEEQGHRMLKNKIHSLKNFN